MKTLQLVVVVCILHSVVLPVATGNRNDEKQRQLSRRRTQKSGKKKNNSRHKGEDCISSCHKSDPPPPNGDGTCPDGVTSCTVDSDCKTCRRSGETCATQRDCRGNKRRNPCEPAPNGSGLCHLPPVDDEPVSKPLKIIVLTGQSNAQGHGYEAHLDALIRGTPGTPSLYDLANTSRSLRHLRDDGNDGTWSQHDNVYITYHSATSKTATFNRIVEGQLSAVGFGSTNTRFGPEVGLGWKLAELLDDEKQQVFILKVAWGGASLYADFRPPSRGVNDAYTEPAEGFGWAYRALVGHMQDTLNNLATTVPNYDPKVGYELEGLVYFQGFSDVLKMKFVDEYELNLIGLISDLRNELNEPNLKIVIGELGMQGPLDYGCPTQIAGLCSINPSCSCCTVPYYCDRVSKLRTTQRFIAEIDENVAFAETGIYSYGHIKDQSHPDFKEVWTWEGHHYNTNADTFYYIGESMAEAMYELMNRNAMYE